MCHRSVKNGFFQDQNAPNPLFGRGSATDPAAGAYDAPPDPLVVWGEGNPFPIFLLLDTFGISISPPSAPRFTPNLE